LNLLNSVNWPIVAANSRFLEIGGRTCIRQVKTVFLKALITTQYRKLNRRIAFQIPINLLTLPGKFEQLLPSFRKLLGWFNKQKFQITKTTNSDYVAHSPPFHPSHYDTLLSSLC
jgi:hypothetical protein